MWSFPEEDDDSHDPDLYEIPGGVAVDSGASSNLMARRHLPGYRVRPSEGSRRKQTWGSASGHGIPNEGEVEYECMDENGNIEKRKTQIGEVRRPLAAVCEYSRDFKICFFCEDENWIIDRNDELASELVRIVQKIKKKQKMHEHKGTYRVRSWLLPGDDKDADNKKNANPFGWQGS